MVITILPPQTHPIQAYAINGFLKMYAANHIYGYLPTPEGGHLGGGRKGGHLRGLQWGLGGLRLKHKRGLRGLPPLLHAYAWRCPRWGGDLAGCPPVTWAERLHNSM